jgi:uncharacterized protein (DUF2236 family)
MADDVSSAASDLGLFGPESVSWLVHSDPLLGIGGLRALYLQALHPRAVAGVAQNSGFRHDPWGRLFRTGDFIATVTFGPTAAAQSAAAVIRARHARLRARDPATGEEFRIDDPDLLRWVHVTETESFVSTVRRGGLRLDDAGVDRYYREQLRAAELIGLDPATVPASAVEVAAYYRRVRPELALTPDAVEAARFVLWPPMPRRLLLTPARPAWLSLATLGFALLPAWARRLYGAPGLPIADLPPTLSARTLRGMLGALPPSLRHGPKVRDALARAAEARTAGAQAAESRAAEARTAEARAAEARAACGAVSRAEGRG